MHYGLKDHELVVGPNEFNRNEMSNNATISTTHEVRLNTEVALIK